MTVQKRRWPLALLLDLVCVVVFVVIGRASHHHGESANGIASTLWPFATGTAVGWAILGLRSRGRRSIASGTRVGASSVGSGATVCVSTVAIGMALRVLAGQGTAASFVAVAAAFLGACMLGWRVATGRTGRLLAAAARRRIRR